MKVQFHIVVIGPYRYVWAVTPTGSAFIRGRK